jgi:hypothetical protein
MTLLSYHSDPQVKAAAQATHALSSNPAIDLTHYEERVHRGAYAHNETYSPDAFSKWIGWPIWLVYLADRIHEGLGALDGPQFRVDLLEAVPVGVDLEPVRWNLAIQRHARDFERMEGHEAPYADAVSLAINSAANFAEAQLKGTATEAQRTAALLATEAAFEASALFARNGPAFSVRSAHCTLDPDVKSAAQSAAWSARSEAGWIGRAGARKAHYEWERNALLQILKDLHK